jgi:hypothetical protein
MKEGCPCSLIHDVTNWRVTWRARVAKREKELVCTIVRKASTTSEEIMKLAIVREIREKLELVRTRFQTVLF